MPANHERRILLLEHGLSRKLSTSSAMLLVCLSNCFPYLPFLFPRAVDFYIGALLSINASPFLLTGADDKARVQLQIITDDMSPQQSSPCAGAVLHGGAPGPISSCKCRLVAGFSMILWVFPWVLREECASLLHRNAGRNGPVFRCEVQLALQKIQSLTSWLQKCDGMISGRDLRN